jgi:hypothetical protein
MAEYKSNSHKSKQEEREKLQPIAKGKKVEKKPESFKDMFKANSSSIKEYIIMDILIPTAKRTISEIVGSSSDILVDTIDTILFGEKRSRGRRRSGSGRTSYYKYYDDRDRDRGRDRDRDRPARVRGYEFDDIILETRREAEEVLDRMEDLIDTYKIVSVADLYDLVGISGNYTDNKYGWSNLRSARVESLRYGDGYILKLPKALPLD